jgi:hypothetical protein
MQVGTTAPPKEGMFKVQIGTGHHKGLTFRRRWEREVGHFVNVHRFHLKVEACSNNVRIRAHNVCDSRAWASGDVSDTADMSSGSWDGRLPQRNWFHSIKSDSISNRLQYQIATI